MLMNQDQTEYLFVNAGAFLNWWFHGEKITGKALKFFNIYYTNYRKNFYGYIKLAWTDRHQELDDALKILVSKSQIKVLDIGSGTGSVSLYMAGKIKGSGNVVGIDFNKDCLNCARERKKVLETELGLKFNCKFVESDLLTFSPEYKFDLIYLEEALHHMEPRLAVIKKISTLLKENGTLIISEVNAFNPFIQLLLMKRRGLKTVKTITLENGSRLIYGDERIMPARVAIKLFMENRLKVESLRYFRFFSTYMSKLFDHDGARLMKLEEKLVQIMPLARILTLHYNLVLKKDPNLSNSWN